MELSELVSYARDKYQIEEQHKWAEFPGFSVLVHPQTGHWVALLMRQWDSDLGEVVERCDLKCGEQTLSEFPLPYLSRPIRMKGQKWISIAFSRDTDRDVVFRLFDRAFTSGDQRGFTMVLEHPFQPARTVHVDTPLPFAAQTLQLAPEVFPERIRQMRHLYEYGSNSLQARAANFYRQAQFMADYEDDADYPDPVNVGYFPTYHDLTTRQLRRYFTWRTSVRKGIFRPAPVTLAYIYIYELLNLVGAQSPEDALDKLKAFEQGFLDSGYGDLQMRASLRRWMTELAIVHALPAETAQQYADPALLERDRALMTLHTPNDYTVDEVFSALCFFDGKRLAQSPVIRKAPEKGRHLFTAVWKQALQSGTELEADRFSTYFGDPSCSPWHPFANAVYCWHGTPENQIYLLDACRRFVCQGGVWQTVSYEGFTFNRSAFHGLLRQADLMLRRYLRQDALITRDSLLTDEERDAEEAGEPLQITEESPPETEETPDLPLDGIQLQVLRLLLSGKPVEPLLREHRLMPTMTADSINEALFDAIGDNILDCDNDTLSLVEDYREDLVSLLGGSPE